MAKLKMVSEAFSMEEAAYKHETEAAVSEEIADVHR